MSDEHEIKFIFRYDMENVKYDVKRRQDLFEEFFCVFLSRPSVP